MRHRGIYYGDPVNRASPLNRGLVSWWMAVPWYMSGPRFIDLCGKNHGTLTNGPTWSGALGRPGWFGAVKGNGSTQYIDCGNGGAATGTTSFGVGGWVNVRASTGGAQALIGRSEPGASFKREYLVYWTDSQWNVQRHDGSGAIAVNGSSRNFGVWYHVFATYDGTTITLYVNGQSDGTPAADSRSISGTTNTSILAARQDVGGTFFLDGAVDGVIAIIGRCPSAAEVYQRFQESLAGYPTTLNRFRRRRGQAQAAAAGGNRRRRVICGASA